MEFSFGFGSDYLIIRAPHRKMLMPYMSIHPSVYPSTNSFPDDNSSSDSPIAFKLHMCVDHH